VTAFLLSKIKGRQPRYRDCPLKQYLLRIEEKTLHKERIDKQYQKNDNEGRNINATQLIRRNELSNRPKNRFC
jgi:hypothetical protein